MGAKKTKEHGTKYWLFVLTNAEKKQGRYNPQVIFDVRTKQGVWGMTSSTFFKQAMKPGDKVIFYIGRPYCAFAGVAELTAGYDKFSKKLQNSLKHKDFGRTAKQGVKFKSFSRFNIQIPVPLIADDLPFIKNKNKWETGLQGSVRKLTRKDYEQIVHAAVSLNRGLKKHAEKLLRQVGDNVMNVNGHDQGKGSASELH